MTADFIPEGQYYQSAEQLLGESDLTETDIRVIGWENTLRIRALTFGQMAKINQLSLDDKGEIRDDEFTYQTISEGVIRPKFTIMQARGFSEKNGEHVKELADKIWHISRVSKKFFDDFVSSQKELRDIEKALEK